MARNENHADQVRRASGARNAAVRRLIAAHKVEYETYYAQEAQARGVIPGRVRAQRRVNQLAAKYGLSPRVPAAAPGA